MGDPEIIGALHGAKVMIDRDTSSVIIAHPDMPPIKFSIEHPYIQGTKLERDARRALSQSPHVSQPATEECTQISDRRP